MAVGALVVGCGAVWWLCDGELAAAVLWPAVWLLTLLWRGDTREPEPERLFDLRQVAVVTDEPVAGDPDGLEALWALPPAEPTYRRQGGRP